MESLINGKNGENSPPKKFTKRLISGITAFVMTISAVIQTGSSTKTAKAAEGTSAKRTYGDLNKDGNIDVFDLMHLKKMLLEETKTNEIISDVDGDGETTFKDITEMGKYIMGEVPLLQSEVKLDTDEDGICDYLETLLGTDFSDPDSDKDGFSDFEELYFLNTDPRQKNTDVTESQRDADNDGLLSIDEFFIYFTDPYNSDSDKDGLNDGKEIELKSDPLKYDTDDDGISDYGEQQLGTDLLTKKSDGITDDNKLYFDQIMPDDKMSDINIPENMYSLKATAHMTGYIGEILSIKESDYSYFLSENAVCGKMVDVSYQNERNDYESSEFEYTLSFSLDNIYDPNDYMIFYYAKDDYILLPFETKYEDNTLSVTYDKPATFCIVDITELEFSDDTVSEEEKETVLPEKNSTDSDIDVTSDENDTESNQMVIDTENLILQYADNRIVNQLSTVKDLLSYSYIFEVFDFHINGWIAELKDIMVDSARNLEENYNLTVPFVFYGKTKYFGRSISYTVTVMCRSSDDIEQLYKCVDEFVEARVKDPIDAYNLYHDVIKKYSGPQYGEPAMSTISYTFGEAPVLFFSSEKPESEVISMRAGCVNCKVSVPNLSKYESCIKSDLSTVDKLCYILKGESGTKFTRFSYFGYSIIDSNEQAVSLLDAVNKLPQTQNGMNSLAEKRNLSENTVNTMTYYQKKTKSFDNDADNDGVPNDKDDDERKTELKNVFIYYINPNNSEKNMDKPAKWMADYLYDNKDCIFYEVNHVADFIDCWNNKIPSKMKNLHLYLHGQEGALTFCKDTENNEFSEFRLLEIGCEMVLNYLIEKKVENKAYLYSCNGGTLHPFNYNDVEEYRWHNQKYSKAEKKYGSIFDYREEFSVAMVLAYLISPTKIEACKNDMVDYFNISLGNLSTNPALRKLASDEISEYPIDPLIAGSGILGIIMYNMVESSSEYKQVYYPVRHYGILNYVPFYNQDSKWINVSYSNNGFNEEVIGDNWTE